MLRTTILIIAASLAACSTTGGTIGGLLPAPRILKGDINDGVYKSPDGRISIATPHKPGTEEYLHMPVKEQFSLGGGYFSFGPAALALQVHRLEVAYKPLPGAEGMTLEQLAPRILDTHRKQLETGYDSVLVEIEARDTEISGRPAKYRKYKQVVPAGKLQRDRAEELDHEAYVMDLPAAYAIVWVQTQKSSWKSGMKAGPFATSLAVR